MLTNKTIIKQKHNWKKVIKAHRTIHAAGECYKFVFFQSVEIEISMMTQNKTNLLTLSFFSSIVEPWNQFQFQFENKIPSSNSISMQQPYCVNDHAENGKSYTQIVNKGFDTDFRHVLFSFRFCVLSRFVFVSDWNSMESLKQYWTEEFRFVSLSFRFARKICSMQTFVKPRLY